MVKLKSTSVWYTHARRRNLNKCSALSAISVYPKYKSAYAQKHYFVPRNIPEISFNNGIAILFQQRIRNNNFFLLKRGQQEAINRGKTDKTKAKRQRSKETNNDLQHTVN